MFMFKINGHIIAGVVLTLVGGSAVANGISKEIQKNKAVPQLVESTAEVVKDVVENVATTQN